MKTAIVVISTLIGYSLAQSGAGAKLKIGSLAAKGGFDGEMATAAVKSDMFNASASANDRLKADARVASDMGSGSMKMDGADKVDVKFGDVDGILEPKLPDFDDGETTNDKIAIDEKVLEQFNLTKADLMNSTEL